MLILEKWVLAKQRKKGIKITKIFLYFFGAVYRQLVGFRHLLYDFGFIKVLKSSLPIVSVGNIVCGGTGKSEFVKKLASDLSSKEGAILTRGYRSKRKGGSRLVKDALDGDEPFMLAKDLKDYKVFVGKKREISATLAKEMGCRFCLLDDGMQYRKLERDVEVVLVRAENPFGAGFVPYGMRRELLSRLKQANYIIIHGDTTEANYELVKRELICYSPAKCFGTAYRLKQNKNIFSGKQVGLFCGIGNPQSFIQGVQSTGLKIVKKKVLADHQKISNLEHFYTESMNAGADFVVCTSKDYVKLNAEEQKLVTPIQVTMEVIYDTKVYHTLIEQINNIIER